VSMCFYVVILVVLLTMFQWDQISSVLAAAPEGKSLVNPFDTASAKDFNVWFVLTNLFINIYGTMTWQNSHAFNASALSAHESRMGDILGRWRYFARNLIVIMLGVCALTFLRHVEFAQAAASAKDAIAGISDAHIQGQMSIPVALGHLLPMGIKGMFLAMMMMALVAGDSAHLHSWGSIFIQDVVQPLRGGKPLDPKRHIALLRWAMVGVAVWALCFSLIFSQVQAISLWWMVTMAVYMSGAGSVVIGGLYWRRGTTAGAWSAMITGSVMALTGILLKQHYGEAMPLNSVAVSAISVACAVSVYVAVSCLTSVKHFDLERMLHREPGQKANEEGFRFSRLLGFNQDFTRSDKIITSGLLVWGFGWALVFIVGCVWNTIAPWTTERWCNFWYITGIVLPLLLAVTTTCWFTYGGVRDLIVFFRHLAARKEGGGEDDGTVHQG
jgi:solute:Na+ symporter, SSS family